MISTKTLLLFAVVTLFSHVSFSQRAKEGDQVYATANNVVNTYTYLTANASAGATAITVNSNAMAGGVFSGNLAPGDLIMIIQMQGATMNNDDTFIDYGTPGGYSVPNGFTWNGNWFDHAEYWGSIDGNWGTSYNNAGKFEQVEVQSVSGGGTINLQCALKNNYTSAGHVQVIRVARFKNLTISGGLNTIIPVLWNGQTGGVVAIEVDEVLTLNAGSSISASGYGFRGGQVDATGKSGSTAAGTMQNVNFLGAPAAIEGSEKGEGIAGFTTEYIARGCRYGISAPANGGGGGGYQNCGGGGGSNIYTGALPYRGTGVPNQGPGGIYTPAWNLDISLPPFPNPDIASPATPHLNFLPIGTTTSPGGGRGGYSLAQTDQNELVVGPRNASWGGDARKSNGGLGGHPLAYDPTRLFFGGGGGAGDQDSNEGGSGGRGGGIVFITNYGSVTGSGKIEANGQNGFNSNPTGGPVSGGNPVRGEDGAGGGGAGGSIFIENATPLPASVLLDAIGGNGGNMNLLLALPGTQPDEASGPGGSGAGGAIAYNSGTPTQNVLAGSNGIVTTNDPTPMMANFPPNGATNGFAGVGSLSAPYFDLIPNGLSICAGNTANISVTLLGALPAGSTVQWYSQQFGGAPINSGLTYTTPALGVTTTYYVGICPGPQTFRVPVVVTVLLPDDASFSYGAASYCAADPDPTPTITGLAGGTFTSAPAGLVINASTGAIDVSASTPGAYTVTYTTNGPCPNSSNVAVTISALDDASFSYSAASYCVADPDPTPTITGLAGGTFSSAPAGLVINASGTIDVSLSTPGAYTVTYTTPAGACQNSSNVAVTITALDDASFNYSAASYCVADPDPTPTITGVAGGGFTSAPAGLVINAGTGQIDVSASTPGAYTVTYTTVGACSNSSNQAVTITALDDASFNYSAASYCVNDADPTPTITGVAGGGFTSAPAGLVINAGTGQIDVSASTPGAYTITYTTVGACSNSSNQAVTINALDDASFNYSAAAYCVNDADPTPTITGLAGGGFTSAPAGLVINAGTGTIDVSASSPGAYTITYTTVGSCPNSSNVAVTINALDNAGFNYSAASYCTNAVDPTPTITGLAGGGFTSAPAGLVINAGTGAIDVSASTPGAYTVTYTTVGSCPNSSNVAVTINALQDASFTMTATCNGGTATITGTAGGSFAFNPAPGDGALVNAGTGTVTNGTIGTTYFVEYTTPGPCPASLIQSVTAATDLAYVPTLTDENCGAGDGIIDLVASGGDGGPYQYSITGGAPYSASGNFTGLSAALYTISILDNSGCEITGTETISSTGGPTINTVVVTDPSCPGACDGSITITVSGGTPPYAYQWYDNVMTPIGLNNPTLSGQCAGDYSVEVTDASGGAAQLYFQDFEGAHGWNLNVVTGAEGADANFFVVNDNEGGVLPPGCGVATNGNKTLHITSVFFPGGGAAYDAGGLCGILFCPQSNRRAESPAINTVGQTGLTLNFDYIANGQVGSDFATVWYNDGFGWTQLGAALSSPVCGGGQGRWSAYSSALPASCENIANLQIAIKWQNNDDGIGTDPSVAVNNIEILTSAVGCPSYANATLTDPAPPNLLITNPVAVCTPGTVDLTAAAVTAGSDVGTLTYWTDAGATVALASPNAVGSGTYYIQLDVAGCTVVQPVTATVNPLPSLTFTAPADICLNASALVGQGGATPAGGLYSGSGVTDDGNGLTYGFDPLAAGVGIHVITYDYTDGNGCSNSITDNIEVFDTPTISGTLAFCEGGNSQLTGSGTPDAGTPWTSSNPAIATVDNTGLVAGLVAGTSDITYLDANGCSVTETVTIYPTCVISTTFLDPSGCGLNDGQITVDGWPGTGTVTWTGTVSGSANNVALPYAITNLPAGAYTLTFVSDVTGCGSNSPIVNLTDPGSANLVITDPAAVCDPLTVDLTAAAITAGSDPGTLTYWTDAGATIALGSPAAVSVSGVYYIQLDNGSCVAIMPVNVTVTPAPNLLITDPAAVCSPNTVDLTAVAVTSGSDPGALTYWSDAGATVSLGAPATVGSGTYYIQLDAGGCTSVQPVTATVNPLPNLVVTDPVAVCSPNTVDLTLAAVTVGSDPGTLTYWSDAGATVSLAGPTAVGTGTYYIQLEDGNTCTSIQAVNATINALPNLVVTDPAAVCSPSMVDITVAAVTVGSDPGTLTYWSDAGATVSLGAPSAVGTGTYYIQLEDGNTCTSIQAVNAQVNPAPVLTITDPAGVCAPNTVDITAAAVTAGSDPGTLTYWSDAGATIAYGTPGAVPSTGTYYIQLEDASTCTSIQAVNVSISSAPNLVITDPAGVCSPLTGDITAAAVTAGSDPGTLTYWSDAGATVSLASPGSLGSGTYYIQLDASGCAVVQPVTVTVNPAPVLVITDPAGVCSPGLVDLTVAAVTAGSDPGTLTYWTDAGATIALGSPTGVGTGVYYIQLEDASTCTSILAVNALVNPLPNVSAVNTGPACAGTSFTLNEVGGDATAWTWVSSGGAFIVNTNDQSPTVSGAVDGETFTVTVMDANGCTNSANTVVSIMAQPVIDPQFDVSACSVYNLPAITGVNLTGSEAYYDDSQTNGGSQITGPITGTQTVYIYDGNGQCSDELSFVVTINQLPAINSLTGSSTYCTGDPVADILVGVIGTPNWTVNYTLDGVPQSATGSSSPVSLGNTPGTYVLIDISDANCTATATGSQVIVVNPYPTMPLAGSDATYCSAVSFIEMVATGAGGIYTWYSDASLMSPIGTGAALTPSNIVGTTTYYVTETAGGCESPANQVVITVEDCEIVIPTAFTPDNDLANDYWEILNLDNNYPDNIVRVYNRWGNLLFEHKSDASNPYSSNMWDGTYQGNKLPVASYYFIIDFNDGGSEPAKGTVSIILNE